MYGLVFSGGGARGAYQIGAWKALKKLGVKVSAVTGTSVGSLNGAFYAQGAYKKAYKVWANIEMDHVMDIDIDFFNELRNTSLRSVKSFQVTKLLTQLFKFAKNRGFDVTPLKRLIEENLDENKIRKSKIKFGLVTIKMPTFKPLQLMIDDIPKGKLVDYMLASSFLPVFSPMKLDGQTFLDGGLYDNIPINLISRTGVKKVIAVDLNGVGFQRKVKNNMEITYIRPSERLSGILSFTPEIANDNINLGYLDTLKAFNKLEGDKFFIRKIPSEKSFVRFIKKASIINVRLMAKVLSSNQVNANTVNDEILPFVKKRLRLPMQASVKDTLVRLLEYSCLQLSIKRKKAYTYNQLRDEFVNKYDPNLKLNKKKSELYHLAYLIFS